MHAGRRPVALVRLIVAAAALIAVIATAVHTELLPLREEKSVLTGLVLWSSFQGQTLHVAPSLMTDGFSPLHS
ncbi:hypothetical protein C5C18_03240 [Rathayibacter tritici]|uniref:hypothetical protein n=1 Tax=Rathayibacter tritici TaxID=33888 RepID=UPI0008325027|nr:hypothetical protein [Rathayibacter tritici]PPF30670.1 hypothetical protein C5C06_04620 [Rathayibacter tritici]PPF70827.1 hypothetical protein C5C21_00790 [Rathayibacter tritici]PPG08835.1 hypothetical protein C5C18_03240 [Rathayibacter tritici]PPI14861.1 hypothetical protein C5D07_07335 [Rathayibacter tritici]PPI44520.1 hypothetical protein C5D18_07540 [Rathayibacter tritici]